MEKKVKFLLIGALIFINLAPSFAFAQTIKVRSAKNGKVKIIKEKLSSVINLSKDLSGCPLVYDGSAPKERKVDVTKFELLDAIKKRNSTYLVLLATMGGNCNIQGECGATEDSTLVWLKLDQRLKAKNKKAVAIDSCRYNRVELVSPVELVNGELKVEYSEIHYGEKREFEFYTLTYKRNEAEKGLMIITEKRNITKN